MLRVRSPGGDVTEVPTSCFVEIVDDTGNVAEALFVSSKHTVVRVRHGDDNYRDYERLYGVKFIDTVVHA